MEGRAGQQGVAAQGGDVAAQEFAERGSAEEAVLAFLDDAHVGQCAEEAVQRGGVRVHGLGDVGGGPRAVRELVGDLQAGGDADGLGDPASGEQADHRRGQRAFGHLDRHSASQIDHSAY